MTDCCFTCSLLVQHLKPVIVVVYVSIQNMHIHLKFTGIPYITACHVTLKSYPVNNQETKPHCTLWCIYFWGLWVFEITLLVDIHMHTYFLWRHWLKLHCTTKCTSFRWTPRKLEKSRITDIHLIFVRPNCSYGKWGQFYYQLLKII